MGKTKASKGRTLRHSTKLVRDIFRSRMLAFGILLLRRDLMVAITNVLRLELIEQ